MLSQLIQAQDSTRHFEFGSTLVTVNALNSTYYSAPDRPAFELMNGLFFRYTKNRLGLRALASYSDNSASYASPASVKDGTSGDIHNRDFRIGAGAQYALIKRKDWLYAFLDLSYRNVFSTGHQYGGFGGANQSFSSTANGVDGFTGLGFKLSIFKNVCLSPELGYYMSTKFVSRSSNDLYAGHSTDHYSQSDLSPVAKLHLTVRF